MNPINHVLTSYILLYLIFSESATAAELFVFAVVFGALIDINKLLGRWMRKPLHHQRTWIEEPFGVLLVGVPAGLALSLIKSEYFWMTLLPYAVHVLQDYLAVHEVSLLARFSNKT